MMQTDYNPVISTEVKVSSQAIEKLVEILDDEDEVEAIRLFVSGGGCGGMTYGMTLAESRTDFDWVYEQKGVKIYVDSVALSFLEGVEIDFKDSASGASFVFSNVFSNVGGAGTCGGCGSAGGGCG